MIKKIIELLSICVNNAQLGSRKIASDENIKLIKDNAPDVANKTMDTINTFQSFGYLRNSETANMLKCIAAIINLFVK